MLYLVKTFTDSTYDLGFFSVSEGYYGPATRMDCDKFLLIEQGNIIPAGTTREFLLLKGIVQPETDEDRAFLFAAVERLQRALGVPEEIDFDEVAKVQEELLDDEMEIEVTVGGVVLEGKLTVEGRFSEGLENVEIPEEFEFPEYFEMLKEMKEDPDFDHEILHGTNPKKSDAQKLYVLFKSRV